MLPEFVLTMWSAKPVEAEEKNVIRRVKTPLAQ